MKVNRNEPCSCGSSKKYKNCCGKDVESNSSNKLKSLLVAGVIAFFGIAVYGVVEYYQSDKPEMERYKCDNPACGQWHYRPVSSN